MEATNARIDVIENDVKWMREHAMTVHGLLKQHIADEDKRFDRIEESQKHILMQVTGKTAFVKGAWFGVALIFSGLGALLYHFVGK